MYESELNKWPETYLGKAEKMLFEHFFAHVRQGEYAEAREVANLLTMLGII